MNLKIVRDDPNSIYMRYPWQIGLFVLLFGALFVYLGFTKTIGDKDHHIVMIVGGFFSLIGVLITYTRYELELFPSIGKYKYLKRIFATTERTGPMSDIDHIYFRKEYRSGGKNNSSTMYWLVGFIFRGEIGKFEFHASASETVARSRFEHFAKTLKIKAVDSTGDGQPQEVNYQEMDDNILEKESVQEEVATFSEQFVPEGLDVEKGMAGFRATFPVLGFNGGLVFLSLFFGVFATVGAFAVLTYFGVFDVKVSGNPLALLVVGGVFFALGMLFIFASIIGSFGRLRLAVHKGQLIQDTLFMGMSLFEKKYSVSDLEEFEVRKSTMSGSRRRVRYKVRQSGRLQKSLKSSYGGYEIVIRTQKKAEVIGRNESKEHLEWTRSMALKYLSQTSSGSMAMGF